MFIENANKRWEEMKTNEAELENYMNSDIPPYKKRKKTLFNYFKVPATKPAFVTTTSLRTDVFDNLFDITPTSSNITIARPIPAVSSTSDAAIAVKDRESYLTSKGEKLVEHFFTDIGLLKGMDFHDARCEK